MTAQPCAAPVAAPPAQPVAAEPAVPVAGEPTWLTAYEAWQRIPEHEQIKLAGISWRAGFDAGQIVNKELLLIEARDNAVRVALIDEIRAYVTAAYPCSGEAHRRYEHLFAFLDSKYTQPKEPSNG